jgi:hypothetical protein
METTMNVSIVVAMQEADGQQIVNPRTVVLTTEGDYIVGALPHTPAAQWADEDRKGLSESVGIPWHPNPKALEEAGLTFTMGTEFPTRNHVIDGSLSPRPERARRRRTRPAKPGAKKRKKR